MVDIVIPIYKKDPTLDDTTAINQAFKLLKGYDITFVHPKSLVKLLSRLSTTLILKVFTATIN